MMVNLESTEPFLNILQLESLKFSVALLKGSIDSSDTNNSLQDALYSDSDSDGF